MPVPSRASLVTVLSSSKSRSEPSTGSTSGTSWRGASAPSIACRVSAAENSMLFSATARRRPSLWSSSVASSASARALAMMIRPSLSVSKIGSVTALMMLDSRPRSRCSRRSDSSIRSVARSAAIRGPSDAAQPARLPEERGSRR